MIKFLEKCAQIERLVSEIYLEFADKQKNDAALAEIWKDMAVDEEAHCQQLSLAARLPTSEAFNGIKKKCPDPGPLYEQAEMTLAKVRNNKFSTLERLKTAVVLEKEFRKLHATYALEFKTTALRSTFDKLARADAEHLRALDSFLKKYKEEHQTVKK